MNGSIVRVLVEPGQTVEAGATLVVLEAMKMEHSIRAPHAGVVKALYCSEGELVEEGTRWWSWTRTRPDSQDEEQHEPAEEGPPGGGRSARRTAERETADRGGRQDPPGR
ncbi:acetyl-CoA carboxylase biotin carboxyl carrier protein subunit [Pseudomonas aeruginosa]|nr:acetyl-CoA carboxylase biotin carboxyl carrier protein subunit [Pseudomonas aeruginosa]